MNKTFLKIQSGAVIMLLLVPLLGLMDMALAQSSDLLFGQTHYYSVVFRGNGETIVYARFVITNNEEKPLKEFYFNMPGAAASEIVIFQQRLRPYCIGYAPFDYNKCPNCRYEDVPKGDCLEYQEPDYNQYYGGAYYPYPNSQSEYKKVQHEKSGNLYKLTLPLAIEPSKTGALIIAYAADGYVKKSLGVYKFNFKTLEVPARIGISQVAINLDSDLILKGRKAEIDYNVDYGAAYGEMKTAASETISSQAIDRIIGNIGSTGQIVKTAKNLAPNESFIIKGEYAASWLKLYFSSIIWSILIIAAILAIIYLIIRFINKRKKINGKITLKPTQAKTDQTKPAIFNLTNISLGLLSAVLVVSLTFAVKFISESLFLSNLVYYPTNPFFVFIALISAGLLYILIIFGPAIVVAVKRGWKSFVFILVAEFVWLLIFLILYFALFQGSLNRLEPYPLPAIENGVNSQGVETPGASQAQ